MSSGDRLSKLQEYRRIAEEAREEYNKLTEELGAKEAIVAEAERRLKQADDRVEWTRRLKAAFDAWSMTNE